MKKELWVFINRPITSKYTKSLIEQVSILKQYENDYDFVFITPAKSKDGMKYVEEVTALTFKKFISVNDLYHANVFTKKHSSWLDFMRNEDWFDSSNVAHIVMFGGMLSSACAINRKKNKFDYYLKNQQQMNFVANGTLMSTILQLLKSAAAANVPFHEICYDTTENSVKQLNLGIDINIRCYHGYDIPRYEMKRFDALQYYILNYKNPLFERDTTKDLDLVFGYTAITEDRHEQFDKITEFIDSLDIKKETYVRHNDRGIDTFIPRDSYLDRIARSKFTFIIPPYDLSHFSIFRILESIDLDCLPLIGNDVKVDEFIQSFGLDEDIIKEITFDYQTYPYITEQRRMEILSYLKTKLLVFEKGLEIE